MSGLLAYSVCTTRAFIAGETIDATIAVLDDRDAVRLPRVLWNLDHIDRSRRLLLRVDLVLGDF